MRVKKKQTTNQLPCAVRAVRNNLHGSNKQNTPTGADNCCRTNVCCNIGQNHSPIRRSISVPNRTSPPTQKKKKRKERQQKSFPDFWFSFPLIGWWVITMAVCFREFCFFFLFVFSSSSVRPALLMDVCAPPSIESYWTRLVCPCSVPSRTTREWGRRRRSGGWSAAASAPSFFFFFLVLSCCCWRRTKTTSLRFSCHPLSVCYPPTLSFSVADSLSNHLFTYRGWWATPSLAHPERPASSSYPVLYIETDVAKPTLKRLRLAKKSMISSIHRQPTPAHFCLILLSLVVHRIYSSSSCGLPIHLNSTL